MKTLQLSVIAWLLLGFGVIMIQVGKQQQIKLQHNAYSVCTVAHFETDGRSEQACASAQDQTHTEFLCSQDGKYCWLEVK